VSSSLSCKSTKEANEGINRNSDDDADTRKKKEGAAEDLKRKKVKKKKKKSEETKRMMMMMMMRGNREKLEQHKRFLYIRIGVSAVHNRDVDMYGGWIESQIPAVLLRLQHMTSSISARPFPRRYRCNTALGDGFCIYIKITNRNSRGNAGERGNGGGGEKEGEVKQMAKKNMVANGSRCHNCPAEDEEKERANETRDKDRNSKNSTMGQRASLRASSKSVMHIKRFRKRSVTPPQLRNDLSSAVADIRTLLEAKLPGGDNYIAVDVQLTKVSMGDFLALAPYNRDQGIAQRNRRKTYRQSDDAGVEKKEEGEDDDNDECRRRIEEGGSCQKTSHVHHQDRSQDLHNLAALQLRYENDYKYYAGNTTETKKRRANKKKNGKKQESQIERQLFERAKTKEDDRKLGLNDVSRMLTIEQMLKNLQYDNSLDTHQVTLVYHDRFKGLKEISLFAYNYRQKQGVTGDFFIPSSRIFYIKMKGKLVWDRIRKRMSVNLAYQKR